jgi:hypothetical protein
MGSRDLVLDAVEGRRLRRAQEQTHAAARSREGRLSDLQGHEDVERRRSARRCQVPPGRLTGLDRGRVGDLEFQTDKHRPGARERGLFPGLAPGSEVFIVVAGERSGMGNGDRGQQDVVELRPERQEDQEIRNPFHL